MFKKQHYQFVWGILLPITLGFSSCAYENEEELFGSTRCQPGQVTYSQVIQPIVANNCALQGCHNGSNRTLPDWTVLQNVQANALLIKERTGNRTMPPSSSGKILSAEQIANIACWVDSGAQDN